MQAKAKLPKTIAACCALAMGAAASAAPALSAEPVYVLENATTLPSTNSSWDYVKLDAERGRFFMGRRADGAVVYDVNRHRVIRTLENSKAANGPLLVPEFNRGYVVNTDGTMLIFDLATLKTLDRIKIEDGDLNGAIYDAATKRVHILVGNRPKTTTWYTFDPATAKVLGKAEFESKKMDDPATDGKGHIFAPMRDNNIILKLSSADLKEQARWTLGDCVQPVALEYDHATNRLLLGCRGDKPVFLAIDADNGKIVAQLPIGKNTDGLGFDEHRHTIVTANGNDANMTMIQQEGPDKYTLLGNMATRPMARIMAMDPKTGRVFIVTADFTQPAAGADGKLPPPVFHDNSFTVLTYKRK